MQRVTVVGVCGNAQNTAAKGAAIVAEEIRTRVEGLGIESREIKSVITVSQGVASVVPGIVRWSLMSVLMLRQSIIQGKGDGRNKVIVGAFRDFYESR